MLYVWNINNKILIWKYWIIFITSYHIYINECKFQQYITGYVVHKLHTNVYTLRSRIQLHRVLLVDISFLCKSSSFVVNIIYYFVTECDLFE